MYTVGSHYVSRSGTRFWSLFSLPIQGSDNQGRHLRGLGESTPKEKEKKKKKERKKRKKEKKKKGTMNNVKLLHIKCCFFPIFQKSGGIEK